MRKSNLVKVFLPGLCKKVYNIDNEVRYTTYGELNDDASEDFEFLYIIKDSRTNCYFVKFEAMPYNTGVKIREASYKTQRNKFAIQ